MATGSRNTIPGQRERRFVRGRALARASKPLETIEDEKKSFPAYGSANTKIENPAAMATY